MQQWCVSFQLLIVRIQSELRDNIVDRFLQRRVVKAAILDEILAVVDERCHADRQDLANVPAIHLGTEDVFSDLEVLLDGIRHCHTKPEEHDADNATGASSSSELEVIGRARYLLQAFTVFHALHQLLEQDECDDTADASTIKGKEAEAIGMPGCWRINHDEFDESGRVEREDRVRYKQDVRE
jgi:hypothetical protein